MDRQNNKYNERLSTYVATLIHDLKTPILAQISAINILLKESLGKLNQGQREVLEQIKESCEYANNLVLAILDTYLYEQGRIPLDAQNFEWNNLINNAINETSSLATDKNQKIIIKDSVKENEILADKFQLKRAIVNLIANAVKYGFNDSTIEVETKSDKNNLTFNVKSTSKHIKTGNLDNLYNKFQTDKRGKTSLSCGLGLYLVKQIINSHNGKVFARSDRTGKCTFGFSIPRKQPIHNKFNC